MPAGRPTDYCKEIADRVCEAIATSRNGLEQICDSDPEFPHPATIYRWLFKHQQFREDYARAREYQQETRVDELLEVARKPLYAEKVKYGPDGEVVERTSGDAVERSKLIADSLKWSMSKLAPKKYGDKITAEHTGADGAALLGTANLVQITQTLASNPLGRQLLDNARAAIADNSNTDRGDETA